MHRESLAKRIDGLRSRLSQIPLQPLAIVNAGYERVIGRDGTLVYVLYSVAYFFWYLKDPAVPANDISKYMGWWGWWDQGQYYKTAVELSRAVIAPSSYWYGYPLLAAPFVSFLPGHPFFFPNYFFGLLITRYFYCIAAKLTSKTEAIVLTVGLILVSERMIVKSLIWPWNSIVCYVAAFAIAYHMCFQAITKAGATVCALLIALAVACRPQDVPWLVMFFLLSLLLGNVKHWIFSLLVLSLSVTLGVGFLGGLNYLGYGHLIPPYVHTAATVGFSLDGIGYRLYQLFIDGSLIHRAGGLPPGTITPTFLTEAPLILLSLGGTAVAGSNNLRPYGLFAVTAVVIVYYTAFNAASNPPHFWSYNLFHYVWWVVVILSLLGYCYLRALVLGRCPKLAHALAAISVLIVLASGYKEFLLTQGFPDDGESSEIDIVSIYSEAMRKQEINITGKLESLDGLRILTKGGTPFHFTGAGYFEKAKLFLGDHQLQYWRDYMFSQDSDVINIHFLHPSTASHLKLEINVDRPLIIEAVSGVGVFYEPFLTFKKLVHWLFGDDAYSLRKVYLPNPYRWGETLYFKTGGNGVDYIGYGWSHPEKTHIWSISREASIFLGIGSRRSSKTMLVLNLASFVDTWVTVKLNGHLMAKRIALPKGEKEVRIPIDELRSDEKKIEINLISHKLVKPSEVDINSSDHRLLGVALLSMRLEDNYEY